MKGIPDPVSPTEPVKDWHDRVMHDWRTRGTAAEQRRLRQAQRKKDKPHVPQG